MRIIVLKKVPGRRWKVGTNLTVHRPTLGKELIKKKLAAEIPHDIGGVWHYKGAPSKTMSELWSDRWVTLENYQNYIKRSKEEK